MRRACGSFKCVREETTAAEVCVGAAVVPSQPESISSFNPKEMTRMKAFVRVETIVISFVCLFV